MHLPPSVAVAAFAPTTPYRARRYSAATLRFKPAAPISRVSGAATVVPAPVTLATSRTTRGHACFLGGELRQWLVRRLQGNAQPRGGKGLGAAQLVVLHFAAKGETRAAQAQRIVEGKLQPPAWTIDVLDKPAAVGPVAPGIGAKPRQTVLGEEAARASQSPRRGRLAPAPAARSRSASPPGSYRWRVPQRARWRKTRATSCARRTADRHLPAGPSRPRAPQALRSPD
jgi:hypothetical protein